MTREIEDELWKRLVRGAPIEGLGLAKVDGRISLRGLVTPEPIVVSQYRTSIADVTSLSGFIELKGKNLENLDFTGSKLKSFRLFNTRIDNCIFDNCCCEDWRMWDVAVINTSFRKADLRGAVLGGNATHSRNVFQNVDFSEADLRGTMHFAAEFTQCTFKKTKLKKVDFQGSAFTDCVFEGKLDEVMFYRYAYKGEAYPPNLMKRVDFRHAKLNWCSFRELDLDTAIFPTNGHIIVENYPQTLDRLLNLLEQRTDLTARRLTSYLALDKKWLGPCQRRGVLSKNDLCEILDPNEMAWFEALVQEYSAAGSKPD